MPRERAVRSIVLVLSCEHGGKLVPARYAAQFEAPKQVLDSHRGWDPGALALAKRLAQRFQVDLFAATTTRLLIDLNRSLHHRRVFSDYAAHLSQAQRRALIEDYYLPHRERVRAAIAERIATECTVLHLAVHSFTPELDGVKRNADLGLLYDPRRLLERQIATDLHRALQHFDPALRVRRNYPYRGAADGFTTALRKEFAPSRYVGIELELNQIHAPQPPFEALCTALNAVLA